MEVRRFTIVAVVGVVVDIAIAYLLAQFFAVPLWAAVVTGFFIAALANYAAHELWTFRSTASRLSPKRAGQYIFASAATLAIRLAVIMLLGGWVSADYKLIVLIVATGVSFAFNFILSKFVVFSNRDDQDSRVPLTGPQHHASNDNTWEVPTYEKATFKLPSQRHALVIPVINEGERIRAQIKRIAAADLPVDVIIADGGSYDGSLEPAFLREHGVTALLTKKGPGKLSAQLRIAYSWCIGQGYDGIVTIDGNGKDGVHAVTDMVRRLDEGYDYVQGSRYLPGGRAENTPLQRTLANRLIHAPLLSMSGRHWFTDTTNGFRAYSARYLLDPRVQPFRDVFSEYELLFYLTVRAGQIGMRVGQVPVIRSYPNSEATPTKIDSLGKKMGVLRQTIDAALGKFSPASVEDRGRTHQSG